MSTVQTYVPTMTKTTANGLTIHTKESMYIVDSGTSLDLMGFSSLNEKEKKIFKQNLGYSDQRHCGLKHTSKTLHQGAWSLSLGGFGDRFSVSLIVGETMQRAWFFYFVAVRRKLPDDPEVKQRSSAASKTSSPW